MKRNKQDLFVDICIEALYNTARKMGYSTISVGTLKKIMIGYMKKYNSPPEPGKIKKNIAQKQRDGKYVPALYQCRDCKKVKPSSEMSVIRPQNHCGVCKNCKKEKKSNVIPFKR